MDTNSVDIIDPLKYVHHHPDCALNQNWDEALQAMADTPSAFRDESFYQAQEELDIKRRTCTCQYSTLVGIINTLNENTAIIIPEGPETNPDGTTILSKRVVDMDNVVFDNGNVYISGDLYGTEEEFYTDLDDEKFLVKPKFFSK